METIADRYAAANERWRVAKIRMLREAALVDVPLVVSLLEASMRNRDNSNVLAVVLPSHFASLLSDETFLGLMKFSIKARIPELDTENIRYYYLGRQRDIYEIRVSLLS